MLYFSVKYKFFHVCIVKSNKLENGETHRGESKDGSKSQTCRKRIRFQKDHHKQ